jgi:glycerol kinase
VTFSRTKSAERPSLILALDQGTTSSRAILFDRAGHVKGVAQEELTPIFPKAGWVELDAEEIWKTQLAVARQVIQKNAIKPQQIAAIAITNQRETVVVWDRRSGKPIANAIVWQDRRTASRCEASKSEGAEPAIRKRTGLLLDPYFSATKIEWLLKHVRGANSLLRAGHLLAGTVDTWILWKLTEGGVHATEPGNASRTMLCNLRKAAWDPELLEQFQIPRGILPEIRPSSGDFGKTKLLGGEIPILGVAGDQQGALFGQTCFEAGMAKCTYGTGCFLLMNTGPRPVMSRHRLLSTIAWQIEDQLTFALEGSIFMGGAIVQWMRDAMGLIRRSSDIEGLASQVNDSQGVYFVPALTGLGAPHWDSSARGLIIGITRGTTVAHIARAALDAIAFQVADVLDAMVKDSRVPMSELRVDGGAAANDLLLQIQADLAGVPVVRPRVLETTALGGAYLAGLAAGIWKQPHDVSAHWEIGKRFKPRMNEKHRSAQRDRWNDALARAKGWEK